MTVNVDAAPAVGRDPIGAKGVFAAVLGNGFEFFDFTVYATYLGQIGQAFFPSDNVLISDLASAATFGVGFIARPLGGAMIGAYGDRAGRKPAMVLSLGLMAVGSGMIAVTPGFARIGVWAPILLIVARLLQGFAVGGEVGPATMFLLEAAPPNRRMFFASWQLASQNLGSLASGLIGVALALILSKSNFNDWGWRIPFTIGVLIAPVGVYIRSQLAETLDNVAHAKTHTTSEVILTVVRSNWVRLLLGLMVISGGTITQYFLITMTPYAIRTLHLPEFNRDARDAHAGYHRRARRAGRGLARRPLGAAHSHHRPAHPAHAGAVSGHAVSHREPERGDAILAIAILSLLHAASVAVAVMLVPLIFPPLARATGLSITYSLGVAIFGGTATYIVTWLVGVTGDPLASTYYVMAANVVMLIAVVAIRGDYREQSAWPPPVDREV